MDSEKSMPDRSEQVSNWFSAAFHLVMIVGVVVGGVWAIYKYDHLLTAEIARAELDRTILEVQGRPSLQIGLEVEQLPSPGERDPGEPRLLAITVQAENTGTRATLMRMEPAPLLVSRVDGVESNGRVRSTLVSQGRSYYLVPVDPNAPGAAASGRELLDAKAIVHPLARTELRFLVEVAGPGVYHASFVARPTDMHPEGPIQGPGEIIDDPLEGTWHRATRYFVVD